MKIKTIFLAAILMILMRPWGTAAAYPGIHAEASVLYDPLSKQVLYAKNETDTMGMASTTKIMTALVALEQYDLDETVTVRREWTGIEGSSMYLRPGEVLTVSDLLYGLLLSSGNDAASVLAGIHPQGTAGFVAQMNQRTVDLGLKQTHFENPSGLDGAHHYTTALDLAVLTAEAMENAVFAKIVATESAHIGGRWLKNHNRLLGEIDACGVKTGYTKACGRCLVSAKKQNGRTLICVTLNDPDDWADHRVLFEYGFSQYRDTFLVGAGDCGSVSLVSSSRKVSRLYTAESYSIYCSDLDLKNARITLCGPRFWYGSIRAGDPYGTLRVLIGDTLLFETAVYFSDTAEEVVPKQNLWSSICDHIFRRIT